MKVHELKVLPDFYEPLVTEEKKFELRKDDRGFHAGDLLLLREYSSKGDYTGREMLAEITYILSGLPWLQDGYVAMSIDKIWATIVEKNK